jgi:hypothetical protein
VRDINFLSVKLTVSHTERQSVVLRGLLYALEANVTSTYDLGKAGVSLIWLNGIMLLFSKISSIVCFKFLFSIIAFHLQVYFFKKPVKHFARLND